MDSFTRTQILGAFRGATRSEVRKVTFAADFDAVDFGRREYYGWADPKIPRRAYLVVERPDGLVALLLAVRHAGKRRGERQIDGATMRSAADYYVPVRGLCKCRYICVQVHNNQSMA